MMPPIRPPALQDIPSRAAMACEALANAAKSDYIGEPISQLEHALQAAHFGAQAGARTEVVLAALFHDIGHLIAQDAPQMEGLGVVEHERLGAEWLRSLGFSETVARLVESHVLAKRYLCWRNPQYFARLSEASTGTLAWQGGPMDADEARTFEADPLFAEILAVRQWDEMAKDPSLQVADITTYRQPIEDHLRAEEASPCSNTP